MNEFIDEGDSSSEICPINSKLIVSSQPASCDLQSASALPSTECLTTASQGLNSINNCGGNITGRIVEILQVSEGNTEHKTDLNASIKQNCNNQADEDLDDSGISLEVLDNMDAGSAVPGSDMSEDNRHVSARTRSSAVENPNEAGPSKRRVKDNVTEDKNVGVPKKLPNLVKDDVTEDKNATVGASKKRSCITNDVSEDKNVTVGASKKRSCITNDVSEDKNATMGASKRRVCVTNDVIEDKNANACVSKRRGCVTNDLTEDKNSGVSKKRVVCVKDDLKTDDKSEAVTKRRAICDIDDLVEDKIAGVSKRCANFPDDDETNDKRFKEDPENGQTEMMDIDASKDATSPAGHNHMDKISLDKGAHPVIEGNINLCNSYYNDNTYQREPHAHSSDVQCELSQEGESNSAINLKCELLDDFSTTDEDSQDSLVSEETDEATTSSDSARPVFFKIKGSVPPPPCANCTSENKCKTHQSRLKKNVSPRKAKKKGRSLAFDGVTVYYFPREQGFTCIPSEGGSTLGMSHSHTHSQAFTLSQFNKKKREKHKQLLAERQQSEMHLLPMFRNRQAMQMITPSQSPPEDRSFQEEASVPSSGGTEDDISSPSAQSTSAPSINEGSVAIGEQNEAGPSSPAQIEPVEGCASGQEVSSEAEEDCGSFLQAIPTKKRRTLLRESGVGKIDSKEKEECRVIRQSREQCGCDCKTYCNALTCLCMQAGISCQVDRLNFPCGCSSEGCANPAGRVEFNAVRVRTHYIHTIMRLELEKREERPSELLESCIRANNLITSNYQSLFPDGDSSSLFSNFPTHLLANMYRNYPQLQNMVGASSTMQSYAEGCNYEPTPGTDYERYDSYYDGQDYHHEYTASGELPLEDEHIEVDDSGDDFDGGRQNITPSLYGEEGGNIELFEGDEMEMRSSNNGYFGDENGIPKYDELGNGEITESNELQSKMADINELQSEMVVSNELQSKMADSNELGSKMANSNELLSEIRDGNGFGNMMVGCNELPSKMVDSTEFGNIIVANMDSRTATIDFDESKSVKANGNGKESKMVDSNELDIAATDRNEFKPNNHALKLKEDRFADCDKNGVAEERIVMLNSKAGNPKSNLSRINRAEIKVASGVERETKRKLLLDENTNVVEKTEANQSSHISESQCTDSQINSFGVKLTDSNVKSDANFESTVGTFTVGTESMENNGIPSTKSMANANTTYTESMEDIASVKIMDVSNFPSTGSTDSTNEVYIGSIDVASVEIMDVANSANTELTDSANEGSVVDTVTDSATLTEDTVTSTTASTEDTISASTDLKEDTIAASSESTETTITPGNGFMDNIMTASMESTEDTMTASIESTEDTMTASNGLSDSNTTVCTEDTIISNLNSISDATKTKSLEDNIVVAKRNSEISSKLEDNLKSECLNSNGSGDEIKLADCNETYETNGVLDKADGEVIMVVTSDTGPKLVDGETVKTLRADTLRANTASNEIAVKNSPIAKKNGISVKRESFDGQELKCGNSN